ncbi:unnamed protein product [Paramecium primaurelia]|uniref:Uncharacterized protein n=1 Tax=Paramecium primaurelia TaxID=5886 RepID=A0A8S1NI21_PARPR|nr:unnamed protein product [Paramecium primaurelia]
MITNPGIVRTKLLESKSTHTPYTQSTFHSPSNSRTLGFFNKELKKIQDSNKLQPFHVEKQSHSATSSCHTFMTQMESAQHQIRANKFGKIKSRKQVTLFNSEEYISDDILELYNEYEKNYITLNKVEKFIDIQIQQVNQPQSRIDSQDFLAISDEKLKLNDLNKMNKVKIQRFKFYYFRIKTKGRMSPVQIFLHCPDRVQSSNIRMFISSKAEFPTKFNSEQIIQAKNAKMYADHNQPYFSKEFLYITLYSDIDFEVTIDIIFGNPIQKIIPRKQQVEEDLLDIRPQTQRIIKRDKIIYNLDMKQYLQKMKNLEQNKLEREQKQQLVLINKKVIQEEKQVDKVCKVLARESINQYREIEKIMKQRREQIKIFQNSWCQIVSLFDFCKEVKTKLEDIKRHKKAQAKGKLLVWQLKTMALMKVQIYGSTPKERTIFKSKLILQSYALLIKKKTKLLAEEVITRFIKKMLLYLTTLNKQQSLIKKVKTIQRKFRSLKLKKRMFRDKFWKQIKENICNIVYQLRRQKDVRNLFSDGKKPTILIDVPVMQSLIDDYCEKARARWMNYINRTFKEKNRAKKIQNVALNFTEPKLYDMPNEYELTQLIDQYAKIKKLY